MSKVTWVLQNNGIDRLTAPIARALSSCKRKFVDASFHCADSFESDVLLRMREEGVDPENPVFFYGSTLVVKGLEKSSLFGSKSFHNKHSFNSPVWISHHKSNMLNAPYKVCPLLELFDEKEPLTELFVRPLDSVKQFGGVIVQKEKFHQWIQITKIKYPAVELNPMVVASVPKQLGIEYRFLCKDFEPRLVSSYLNQGRFETVQGAPEEVWEKARKFAAVWTPSRLCTMDLVSTDHGIKIVEFNSIHCCGIYKIDPLEFIELVDCAVASPV